MSLPPRYRVQRELVNRVFARDDESNRDVVIKELTLGRIADWKELELFEREAKTLRQLDHPAIPPFFDSFCGESEVPSYYLVCARADGRPLSELIDELDEADLLAISRTLLEVLAYLQAFSPPIVHRNISPAAILVAPENETKLIDFGAVQVELHATVGGSTVVGTSGYMAPEQLLGRAVPSSDLYSLGAVLVHVVTGIEPSDLALERMKLQWRDRARFGTPRFLDWVDRLVEPDPRDRFPTAVDALRGLGEEDVAGVAMIHAGRPRDTRAQLTCSPRRLELSIPRPRLRFRRAALPTIAVALTAGALVDGSRAAALFALTCLAIWAALAIKDYVTTGDTHFVVDVDRGYRLRGPDGVYLAGPIEDVHSVETGFRGELDALWLNAGEETRLIASGLSVEEREWLRDEITAFVDGHQT